jgi:hypothetical protein
MRRTKPRLSTASPTWDVDTIVRHVRQYIGDVARYEADVSDHDEDTKFLDSRQTSVRKVRRTSLQLLRRFHTSLKAMATVDVARPYIEKLPSRSTPVTENEVREIRDCLLQRLREEGFDPASGTVTASVWANLIEVFLEGRRLNRSKIAVARAALAKYAT